jgi:hypothetical protein
LRRARHDPDALLARVVEPPRQPPHVAGVEPHLVHPLLDRFEGELVVEVDVRHEGHVAQEALDRPQGLCVRLVEDRHADDLAPGVEHPSDLGLRGLEVGGLGRGQGLDPNRVLAPDDELPAAHLARLVTDDHGIRPSGAARGGTARANAS